MTVYSSVFNKEKPDMHTEAKEKHIIVKRQNRQPSNNLLNDTFQILFWLNQEFAQSLFNYVS